MESDLTISRNVNVKLMERLVVTEQKCWANEQYSRRECLEISGIPESVITLLKIRSREYYVE